MQEQIRIRTQDGQYLIIGGDFQSMLRVVRELPGRRFRGDEKIWEIPARIEEVQRAVEAAGFHVTADSEMGHALSPAAARREPEQVRIRTSEGDKAVVGGDFKSMLAVIKELEGRQWLAAERIWAVPGPVSELVVALAAHGLQLVDAPEKVRTAAPKAEAAPRRRDQIRIRTQDGDFWVVGGPFSQMLEAVKALEGRRFVSADKLWELPLPSAQVAQALADLGLALEPVRATPDAEPQG